MRLASLSDEGGSQPDDRVLMFAPKHKQASASMGCLCRNQTTRLRVEENFGFRLEILFRHNYYKKQHNKCAFNWHAQLEFIVNTLSLSLSLSYSSLYLFSDGEGCVLT